MNPPFPSLARNAAVAFATALLGSGCVAFNVGKPETFTNRERIVETSPTPVRTEVLHTDAQLQKHGNETVVGLGLDLLQEFEKRESTETVTVRVQKRISIGLFPGHAEYWLMPSGALKVDTSSGRIFHATTAKGAKYALYASDPDSGSRYWFSTVMILTGILPLAGTLDTLCVEPFAGWGNPFYDLFDASHVERRTTDKGYVVWDAGRSPKLQSLASFPESTRRKMRFRTCFDQVSGGWEQGKPIPGWCGVAGCYKYLAVFVDGPAIGPSTVVGTETERRNAFATGPFIAEFSIPELGHNDWKRVAAGGTQATFALPAVERDCTVEAVVSFREDNTVNGRNAGDLTRQAIAKAAGRQWRFDVALKGTGRTQPPPSPPPPPEKLYDGITITPMDEGKYLVKVTVRDTSKTFTVLHLIKAEVQRLAREDFRSRHPGEPAEFIRESIRYETEEGGKILAFTGWVFSVRPAEDGWRYDDESRRGWIRLRVTGGIPAAEAEKWAHENIGEIVKYKNVALEEGKAPPPGAIFRSLSEHFAGGVLTVEFEAVE